MELGFVLIPFLIAAVLPLLGHALPYRWFARSIHWVLTVVMLCLFAWGLALLPRIEAEGAILLDYAWIADLDLSVALHIDGLAAIFVLLITGIGAAVFFYAGYYMEGNPGALRFYALLSAFTGSMLGVVLAGNILLLFICWELTSIFSFTLIGFDGEDPAARSAASQALVITAGGGLALLVGLVLLGVAGNTFEFAQLVQMRLVDHPWYTAIAVLVMVGCFTKSAQFPFHFWLPGGMTAPTPASAFLHSATMVKAGVYLLARLYPTLGDSDFWFWGLTSFGLMTALVGALNAVRQRDLKGLLAYATVSWLGILVFLLGQPHSEGYVAALVGIIAHALYKSPMFMVAGAVDHATGTRNLDRIHAQFGGLLRRMPGAAITTVLAALSMAGVVPFLGFVAKELLLEVSLESHKYWIFGGVFVAAAFTVTAALIVTWDLFFQPAVANNTTAPEAHASATATSDTHDAEHRAGHTAVAGGHFHPVNRLMLVGPGIIAALSLILAFVLEQSISPLVSLASHQEVELHLFHGFNTIFLLSLLALATGAGIFGLRRFWLRWPLPERYSGAAFYRGFIELLHRAGALALTSQNGKLSHYLAIMLGVVGILLALPARQYISGSSIEFTFRGSIDFMKAVLLLLALSATLASILFRGHLLAALALGIAGYAVGGIFLLEPGPDVAMVQILVETLAAVLVIVMLSRITERKRRRVADALWSDGRKTLWRDVTISVLVAVGVGVFALAAIVNRPERTSLVADWYLENAELAGVIDVVGSMITDFRGTDTMIEITVFSMAALGVLTVLLLTRNEEQQAARQSSLPTSQIATPLTKLAATVLLPIALVIALAHLLYAGSAPGDGFTAGVIGGISIAMWYEVYGYGSRRLRSLRAELLIGVGLVIALTNALLPLFLGGSFLEHNPFGDIPLPAHLHVSSSTIFEIAIFLTVFGCVVTMINAITSPEGIEEV